MPLFEYYGMYVDTFYSTVILPCYTRAITHERVDVTLVKEAMSNIVLLVIGGLLKGGSL